MKQSLQGSDVEYRRVYAEVQCGAKCQYRLSATEDTKLKLLCIYIDEAGLLTHTAWLLNYTTAEV